MSSSLGVMLPVFCAAACILAIVHPGGSEEFPSSITIEDPGEQMLVESSIFEGRVEWIFPTLSFPQTANITSWIFRATPTLNWTQTPSFILWKESTVTPGVEDFKTSIFNRFSGHVELVNASNPAVFQLILDSPLIVDAGDVLGVRLPEGDPLSLKMVFLRRSVEGDPSYYSAVGTRFLSSQFAEKDTVHLPLVSPVLEIPVESTVHQSSSRPIARLGTSTVVAPAASGLSTPYTEPPSPQSSPAPSPTDPSSPSSPLPVTTIVIAATVTGGVLLLIVISLVVLLVLIKCRNRRIDTKDENVTCHENRTATMKSTSSNGSYHAYAIPTPSRFASATLPHIPTASVRTQHSALAHQHYEFASNLEDSVRSHHLYDLPTKAATMPLPYEVPMANREPYSRRHHAYSELECGQFPTLFFDQEDKGSLTSDSRSQIFDNAIYRPQLKTVRSNSMELLEDLYWKPATSSALLYDQLSRRKFKEILREKVTTTDHLGSGQFGTVSKGMWQALDGPMEVAVKQLPLSATEEDRVKFLQEAAIMGQFFHPNVVKLHGVVTKDEPIMIILEYMPNGDLRGHLLKISLEHQLPPLFPEKLLLFCQEVAMGMKYLSKKAFVHRDLAARNILLDSNNTCKIGDFGMSRDLVDSEYYVTHGGKIPIKWTSPEALHFKKYSTASDVWSFGCLMYEIWSVGHKPFEGYSNMECIQMISRDYRLPPPPGCSRALYQLMIMCWHKEASKRPTFSEVQTTLRELQSNLLGVVCPLLGGPLEVGEELYSDLQNYYKDRGGGVGVRREEAGEEELEAMSNRDKP